MRAPRPSPALVVACLALVVASAQPVSAAVSALVPTNSVGTAQLKDGAVTTPKLHDGAVTARKIALGTVTGARIANGSVGLVDLAASARPAPPHALIASGDVVNLSDDGVPMAVVALTVPAGTWLISAKTVGSTTGGVSGSDTFGCHLYAGETFLDFGSLYAQVDSAAAQIAEGTVALTGMATVGAATVLEVRCFDANDSRLAQARASKLAAIQVTN
jgi:hypothetical protein